MPPPHLRSLITFSISQLSLRSQRDSRTTTHEMVRAWERARTAEDEEADRWRNEPFPGLPSASVRDSACRTTPERTPRLSPPRALRADRAEMRESPSFSCVERGERMRRPWAGEIRS